jgi:hypothetical protein
VVFVKYLLVPENGLLEKSVGKARSEERINLRPPPHVSSKRIEDDSFPIYYHLNFLGLITLKKSPVRKADVQGETIIPFISTDFCVTLFSFCWGQVPQYIIESWLESSGSHCSIVCTQPRRISAIGQTFHIPIGVRLFRCKS